MNYSGGASGTGDADKPGRFQLLSNSSQSDMDESHEEHIVVDDPKPEKKPFVTPVSPKAAPIKLKLSARQCKDKS